MAQLREQAARAGLATRVHDWNARDVAAWANVITETDTVGDKLLAQGVNGECMLYVESIFKDVGITEVGHLFALKKALERLPVDDIAAAPPPMAALPAPLPALPPSAGDLVATAAAEDLQQPDLELELDPAPHPERDDEEESDPSPGAELESKAGPEPYDLSGYISQIRNTPVETIGKEVVGELGNQLQNKLQDHKQVQIIARAREDDRAADPTDPKPAMMMPLPEQREEDPQLVPKPNLEKEHKPQPEQEPPAEPRAINYRRGADASTAFSSVEELLHEAIAVCAYRKSTCASRASLSGIYAFCESHSWVHYKGKKGAPRKITESDHWKANVRQTLYTSRKFARCKGQPDQWEIFKAPSCGGRKIPFSLLDLIQEGYIEPGENVLSCPYLKEHHFSATLLSTGQLLYNGETFESPSSWSIHVKRSVNPSKKADDGWKSTYYVKDGTETRMEEIKHRFLKKKYGMLLAKPPDALAPSSLLGAKRPKLEARNGSLPHARLGGGKGGKGAEGSEDPDFAAGKGKGTGGSAFGGAPRPNRPKRDAAQRALKGIKLEAETDGHKMVPLERYDDGTQPFAVLVSPCAAIVMDLHAHMSESNEIIGLLGGYWDARERVVTVERAFPVRELRTEDDTINVEMDPESEVAVRDEIRALRMVCCGWYHSHPTFPPIPSVIDLKNQLQYQRLVRDEKAGAEPFVAGIVSPYNAKTPALASDFTWFYVSHQYGNAHESGQMPGAASLDGECLCMALDVAPNRSDSELIRHVMGSIKKMVRWYAPKASRIRWQDAWVGAAEEGGGEGGGVTNGKAVTKLEKMFASISSRVDPQWSTAMTGPFFSTVKEYLVSTWELTIVQHNLDPLDDDDEE